MPHAALEEMRLLSNLETARDKLLQIVLFGQPELDKRLGEHSIRQLRERITYGFELVPLTRADVGAYVEARLAACGYRGHALFRRGAVTLLARHSQGLLRRINVLADKALLAAFADQAHEVRAEHVRRAARDSEFQRVASAPHGRWLLAGGGLVVVFVGGILLGIGWDFLPHGFRRSPVPATAPTSPETPAMLAPTPALPDLTGVPLPRVDPATGFVDDAHLAPRLLPPLLHAPESDPDSS